ncbi:MAG TPA: preprotein translocase subunit SecG [Rhodanobacteraceae bacterium]|jgi:preprotein translocase subunit SecG|nr:preprotein translocase subunit SecG [Rhodanobacteraceae bacterium]
MLFTIFSVFYVLIAAAMIVLILMQRGDGANAGASFGGGSTGTVFGARGAASFLTRTTGVLAALFFILSLGMGIYLSHHGVAPNKQQALGVMAGAATPASPAAATSPNIHPLAAGTSVGPAAVPAGAASSAPVPVQHSEVPVAPPASGGTESAVPAAPAKTSTPAVPAPAGSAPPASH